MIKALNGAQFLCDVSGHKMTVRLNSGVYRHLHFRAAKDSWNMWFEVVTWPGSLAIHGDMGTWTFSRLDDMFDFFRSSELKINASYWGEKIQAESRFGGPYKIFDSESFKANVLSSLDGYGLDECEVKDIAAALEDEVFAEEDEQCAYRALAEFKYEGGFQFSDYWEISGMGYSYHFLWCLYAIVWGIQQYDLVHASQGVNTTD